MIKRKPLIKEISKKYGIDYDDVMTIYYKIHYEAYKEASRTKDYKLIYSSDLEKKLCEKVDNFFKEKQNGSN